MSTSSSRKPRGGRSDARRNRERIVSAAREAYASRGIAVPLAAIARRAGVGQATLYRHFPTGADLVAEAFAEQLAHCRELLGEALADPDPWHGLSGLIRTVCDMQVADRGFTGAFLAQYPGTLDHELESGQAEAQLTLLIRRAQIAGQARADLELSDVVLVFLANGGIPAEPPAVALAASRRLVALLLDSFRVGDRMRLPPAAPVGIRNIHAG